MPAALLAASVVVVPSIEPESFGRIAVEAQAVGTPVVVSDLGALPETVLAPPDVEPARRTGWRISPSDSTLLADALGEALALGASGREALGRARAAPGGGPLLDRAHDARDAGHLREPDRAARRGVSLASRSAGTRRKGHASCRAAGERRLSLTLPGSQPIFSDGPPL